MNPLQRSMPRIVGMLFLSTFCVALKCSDDDSPSPPDEETGGNASSGSAGKPTGGSENTGGAPTSRGGSGGSVPDLSAGEGGSPSAEDGGGGAGFGGSDATAGIAGESPEGGAGGEPAAAAGTSGQGAATEPEILVPFGVISTLSAPATIAVDDEYVYWTSAWVGADPPTPSPPPTGAYLMRVPKNGGEPSALYEAVEVVDGQPRPLALSANFAMDATSLYVSAGYDIYNSLLIKVAKDGSSVEQIAVTGGLDAKRHFAIDDQNVYFEGHASGEIHSVPLDGGDVVVLVDDNSTPLPDGFSFYPNVNCLITDGSYLYYEGSSQGMFKVPVGGGQPVLLSPRNMDGANFSHSGSWPALADGFLYWNYYGYIYKVPVDGGELTTVVEPTPEERSGSGPQTVIDGGYIYYNDYGLQKAALDGSSRVRLLDAAANYSATEFAIDETHVYMFAFANQGIIKLPK